MEPLHRPSRGTTPVIRFVFKRLGLALITLFLLSVVVFAVSNILPGQRRSLGARAVRDAGVGRRVERTARHEPPLLTQYLDWAGGLVQGDLGMSLQRQVPAWDLLGPAILNSAKLALLAFVICIPLSILGGVIAALRYGKPTDKSITVAGISLAAMPDYVSGIVLILVFGIWLGWLPVTAQWPDGAGP